MWKSCFACFLHHLRLLVHGFLKNEGGLIRFWQRSAKFASILASPSRLINYFGNYRTKKKKKTTHPRRKLKSNLPVQWNSTFARLQMLVKWLNIHSWLLRGTKLWLKHEKKKCTYRLWGDWQSRGENRVKLCTSEQCGAWGIFVFISGLFLKWISTNMLRTLHLNAMGQRTGLAPGTAGAPKREQFIFFFLMYNFFIYEWLLVRVRGDKGILQPDE